tara:strand:- start:132 stop:650 length:519 start_codon:yes stop_codon:yes gene_type:complete
LQQREKFMPSSYSFDVVSEFDQQELVNAIDQLRREVDQRYDLKDSKTKIDIQDNQLSIVSLSDMTIQSVKDILLQKATKRNLSLKIFDFQKIENIGGNMVMQNVLLKKGLSQENSKKLSKLVRDNIKKVTVSIQGDSLRITGKNKDDLQSAINLIKKQEDDLDIALQFENYR